MKLATTALAAALLAFALAACGGDGEEQETTTADPKALEASAWVLSDGIDVADWEQTAPNINFERGHVGGSNGCNSFGGSYETDGSSLKLGETASTARGCPPPADEVELAFMESLEGASEWRIEDGELILSGGEHELRFQASSPEGNWRATSLLQGDAVSTLLPGTEITADFSPEGGVSGSSGCNEYTASYRVSGSSIAIQLGGVTEMGCATQPATEQELAYLDALPRSARFRIENGNLVLLTAKDTIVVTLEPAPEEGSS